jgi:hypothetical protein
MKEHCAKAAAGCLKIAKAHQAMASCHRGLMGKADAASYHEDLAMSHDAASEGFCEIAEAIIAASKTPDVDAGGIDRHATEMGGTDFSAVFGNSDMSKLTGNFKLITRAGSAPVDDARAADFDNLFQP